MFEDLFDAALRPIKARAQAKAEWKGKRDAPLPSRIPLEQMPDGKFRLAKEKGDSLVSIRTDLLTDEQRRRLVALGLLPEDGEASSLSGGISA